MIYYGSFNNPNLGTIWIGISPKGLRAVKIGGDETQFLDQLTTEGSEENEKDQAAIQEVAAQLEEYFEGIRREFEVELDLTGLTEFQRDALQAAMRIPPGEVRTYGHLAEKIGRSVSAARAIGGAMAANPIPIVIPCHRVVGSDGSLTGYGGAGGIQTKAWLLEHEGFEVSRQISLPL